MRVLFFLHTNQDGMQLSDPNDALKWDEEFKWRPKGLTLVDGDFMGNSFFFEGQPQASVILQRGFKVHTINSDDFVRDLEAALQQADQEAQEAKEHP